MTSEILTREELMELQVKESLEDALEIDLLNESVAEWVQFSIRKKDFTNFAEKLEWNWEKLFACIYYEINETYPDRLPIFKTFLRELNFDTTTFLTTNQSPYQKEFLMWDIDLDPPTPPPMDYLHY